MRHVRFRNPKEVFLSHANADRSFLNRLIAVLRSHGISYWYSKTHLLGAQQWHDEIGRALGRCDWFLVVLSPAATKSEWVKRELVYALNEQRYTGKIVPVLLLPCNYNRLSWTLGEFQTVNFASGFDEGCRNLLKVWGRKFQEPNARAVAKSRKSKKNGVRRKPKRR
jgi:hypothetical protein